MNSYGKYTYPLFESILVKDGKIPHLSWHQQRVTYSYEQLFGGACPFDLQRILSIPRQCREMGTTYKLRFFYHATGYDTDCSPYHPRRIRNFALVTSDDTDYPLKYTDRTALERLRKKSGADEIIIVRRGMITDTSFSNLAFFDGTEWHTPHLPLLRGTARERLLRQGIIREKPIYPETLDRYSRFSLINALLEWGQQEFDTALIHGG